jgi:hypothetical protein
MSGCVPHDNAVLLYTPSQRLIQYYSLHHVILPDFSSKFSNITPIMEPLCFSSIFFLSILTYMALLVTAQTNITRTSPSPRIVPGNTNYELLGCYNELPPNSSGIALGVRGTYMSPIFGSNYTSTVPLCLEGCGVANATNSSVHYIYAAVENGR